MRAFLSITMFGAMTVPALAAEMNVSVEIPKLNVAEYHRPYVAIWLEKPDQSFVGNLAVWYDVKLEEQRRHQVAEGHAPVVAQVRPRTGDAGGRPEQRDARAGRTQRSACRSTSCR